VSSAVVKRLLIPADHSPLANLLQSLENERSDGN